MGSARVQYELERTLPSLQLAAAHGLFSKDVELRSVTQRRRQFENALVRRVAIASDFVQYIQFEEELEKLRVLRVTRLKDINKIPRADMIKMQKEAIAHIVSIFERGVRRLRYNLDLWKYYIRWAHSRKMRVVVSRISARALALFPNKPELWLMAANIELNDHQSVSTSRALLQRGLRLNSISHTHSLQVQADNRPHKRTKRASKDDESTPKNDSLDIVPAGNEKEDRATLILSEAEQDLVKLWVEYIRMELVFVERLRRRKIVLGIHEDAIPAEVEDAGEKSVSLEDELATEQVPISNQGEVVPPSLDSMREEEGSASTQSSSALLQGAIPKTTLLSAISLQSPTSLPPRTHFALLLAASQLYRSFPFCDDMQGLRDGLLSQVKNAIQSRFPTDPSVMLLLSASELLDSTMRSSLSTLSEMEIKEELLDGILLKKASVLSLHAQDYLSLDQTSRKEDVDTVVLNMISRSLLSLAQTALVASHMKSIIESFRKHTLLLTPPSQAHFAAQFHLVRELKHVVQEKELEKVLELYIDACSKRILQDARKMACEGAELEAEQCRGKLADAQKHVDDEEAAKIKANQVEQHIWKAHLQYPSSPDLLHLYAHSLVLCSRVHSLSQEEMMGLWHKLQKDELARDDAEIWEMWSEWVGKCGGSAGSSDTKWKESQMEMALLQTLNSPAAHERVLQAYLSHAASCSEATKRISFIERKAFPKPSLWRWMIDHSSSSSSSNSNRLGSSKGEEIEMMKLLHRKLTQATSEIEDYRAYLSFLTLAVDESATALAVFQEAQTRVGKDARKRVALESAWQDICTQLRAQQEKAEDEEEFDSEVEAESE